MNGTNAWANAVLSAHAFVGVAIFGGLAIAITGQLLHWRWTQANGWRIPHLAITVYLALRSSCGLPCPLSLWEDSLRAESFVAATDPTLIQNALRFLAFRNLDSASFTRAMVVFASVTAALFLAQRFARRHRET